MIRPDSPSWTAAKGHGDHAEHAIADWFRGRGFEPFLSIGPAQFDLLLQCRVEVKHDLRARETGNVAIEVEYNGQASGIKTSQAAWWAIVVDREAHLVKTPELLRLVMQGSHRVVPAGDGQRSRVALVPIEDLRRLHPYQSIAIERDGTN
jgi:hypothetical protein